ncbi:MAG: copper resistance protein CopZ [Clostridiales bacterium]|nr:copper resistance protein CopZ [Clostridiales bacterium]
MIEITVGIDGMMCGMCENHINDEIRKSFKVKKVSSSHTKGRAVIVAENDISDEQIKNCINPTGYTVTSVSRKPYEKKGFLSFLR